ncbi:unnamed protein product [Cylindrotheca closterium]|uniref:Uncharacterized protein n=1 Tax=Cylindrotheca closterium TaxID=2856 RepID=A0AAD2G8Y2_9STRA|nr:unnamed protein product [Cylindrotheca closterium]
MPPVCQTQPNESVQTSTGGQLLPDGSVLAPGRNGVVIGGSPAGLSLLSNISSITQLLPAAKSVSIRSSVPTDLPEELVDSDHEDALDLDELDDHSIENEEDFQHLNCEAEEADRILSGTGFVTPTMIIHG